MVANISTFLTGSTLSSISQSTTAAVTLETTMKALGRPSFILADSKLSPETKRYAAMKEFLYQATCLATYMLVVVPLFKNGGFKLAKKLMKNEPGFQKFDSAKQFLDYKKLASMTQKDRIATLQKDKYENKFSKEIKSELMDKKDPNPFHTVKGTVELANIIGSVLGLAIFAPQVSHLIVHPTLQLLGFEKKEPKQIEQSKVDVKA